MKKKVLLFLLIAVALLTFSACAKQEAPAKADPSTNITSPMIAYDSIGELSKALNFNVIALPESAGYQEVKFYGIDDKIGQIDYVQEGNPNLSLSLRTAKGESDISGYHGVTYTQTTMNDYTVNIGKGDDDSQIAWFSGNGNTYALFATGLSSDAFNTVLADFTKAAQ